jgi:F-type H+-transporting ATPase subunit delta
MDIGVIAKRYAKALLAYAVEEHAEDTVYAEVQRFTQVYHKLPEMHEMLSNPLMRDSDKVQLLCRAAAEKPSAVYSRFARLVVDHRRAAFMLFIAHSYVTLYRAQKHISIARLTTAAPVSDAVTRRLKDLVARLTDGAQEVQISSQVEPNLLGGFRLTIDDLQLDASVATQFERIKKQFVEQNKRIV